MCWNIYYLYFAHFTQWQSWHKYKSKVQSKPDTGVPVEKHLTLELKNPLYKAFVSKILYVIYLLNNVFCLFYRTVRIKTMDTKIPSANCILTTEIWREEVSCNYVPRLWLNGKGLFAMISFPSRADPRKPWVSVHSLFSACFPISSAAPLLPPRWKEDDLWVINRLLFIHILQSEKEIDWKLKKNKKKSSSY